ncbi:hypothetical protein F5Y16DRAFT_14871 [Xylariaceae sp. FL0255]|nr:hypothetical protein F5Y16DRAFT_14871 [Xylariaceae sp. FL0255]
MESSLTNPQLRALLDILIHHETYEEVQSFRRSDAIDNYGWPFVDRDGEGKPVQPSAPSSSPLLQLALNKLVLGIPGVRDVSNDFWPVKFKGIMKGLGNADLSDSYEKGTLGTRKRLASAASVVHEAVTRGLLGGIPCHYQPDLQREYDITNPGDLSRAWHDCIYHLVYGNLIDEVFDQFTRSEDFEAHSPAVKVAVEYAIFYIATFLHQIFVLSAEGPFLLKLIENVNKLVPYTVIGQTLRVGNAATMINAMSRLFLAKVSLGAISNWMGLTSNAADGMNLLQRIISLVLDWDASDFRKAVDKIKQSKDSISAEQIAAIDKYLEATPDQHDAMRKKSIKEGKSIIIAIFEDNNPSLTSSMTDQQHTTCLQYVAAKLAIRDREQITNVLCRSAPDLTTTIITEGIEAFEPMIRAIHKAVDLRKHVNAAEGFVADFIKSTRPKTSDSKEGNNSPSAPSVEDFVKLLQRNRHLLWAYLHDFASGCPELRDIWKEWANETMKVFRQASNDGSGGDHEEDWRPDAGDMGPKLQSMFAEIPDTKKGKILSAIDAHAQYLSTQGDLSKARMASIIDNVHGRSPLSPADMSGPGIYASRWQSLLDETLITPAEQKGPPRRGRDVKGLRATRKLDTPTNSYTFESKTTQSHEGSSSHPPDASIVVEALGSQFRTMMAEVAQESLRRT